MASASGAADEEGDGITFAAPPSRPSPREAVQFVDLRRGDGPLAEETGVPIESFSLGLTCEVMHRSADRAVCRMPFTDGVRSATGVVHAGAIIWLADLTATFLARAGATVADDGRGFPLLIDLHASILANQQGGYATAEATVVRRGRRVTVIRTRVTGAGNKLLAELTTTHIPW